MNCCTSPTVVCGFPLRIRTLYGINSPKRQNPRSSGILISRATAPVTRAQNRSPITLPGANTAVTTKHRIPKRRLRVPTHSMGCAKPMTAAAASSSPPSTDAGRIAIVTTRCPLDVL